MTASPAPGASSDPRDYLEVRRLGRTPYGEAHSLQQELLAQRIDGAIGDLLLLTEHDPVITLGRGTPPEAAAGVQVPVIEVERGGEATYHGPGQVVAYPILALPEGRRDLHRYLRDLEEVVIGVLAEFDVEGRRSPGETGVWIGNEKVCSVGVAVRRWVTWHGFALNVSTDLTAFRGFRPCGLDPDVMTRLADHSELPPGSILVEVLVVKHFCRVFELELPPMPMPEPGSGENPDSGACGGPPGFPSLPILPN